MAKLDAIRTKLAALKEQERLLAAAEAEAIKVERNARIADFAKLGAELGVGDSDFDAEALRGAIWAVLNAPVEAGRFRKLAADRGLTTHRRRGRPQGSGKRKEGDAADQAPSTHRPADASFDGVGTMGGEDGGA